MLSGGLEQRRYGYYVGVLVPDATEFSRVLEILFGEQVLIKPKEKKLREVGKSSWLRSSLAIVEFTGSTYRKQVW